MYAKKWVKPKFSNVPYLWWNLFDNDNNWQITKGVTSVEIVKKLNDNFGANVFEWVHLDAYLLWEMILNVCLHRCFSSFYNIWVTNVFWEFSKTTGVIKYLLKYFEKLNLSFAIKSKIIWLWKVFFHIFAKIDSSRTSCVLHKDAIWKWVKYGGNHQ